ncbi:MAG: DEAD/DEAH box helicase [Bacteroidales bacterium]|nr:DEAD/DEAH box helicase [Bacteroidales bacterium]
MKFIVTIKEHRVLGYILSPYFVIESQNGQYYSVKESIVLANIEAFPTRYTPEQKQIVKLVDEYSDAKIAKTFGGRKKPTPQDFFASIDEKYVEEYIRPSIEKKIIKILEICRQAKIKIFFKDVNINNVFIDDELILCSQTAQAVFNFERTQTDTRYYLTVKYKNNVISLLDKKFYVLSNSPCVCIINNRIYFFESIDAKKLVPFTSKQYVSVLKRVEPQYYEKFIKNAIAGNYIVKPLGFKIISEKSEPQAILVVEQDLLGDIVFNLNFRYNGISFLISSTNYILVKFYENNGDYYFTKLVRDIEFEQETENSAFKIFGSRVSPGSYKVKSETNDKEIQRAFAINCLNNNKEKLAEAGITIEQNLFEKVFYTGKISLKFKVTNHTDWFDIYAIVNLEDIEIPFISLKYYILNNIREFTLPDGRVVILPEEWFERYRELFAYGNINKEENLISLKNYQYSTLAKLPLENEIQHNIENLQNQLENFENMKMVLPNNVNATLRPYQITAYNWLKMMRDFNFGACLADDMGLGKTLCTLSLLANSCTTEVDSNQLDLFTFSKKKPSLLLVPKSLIYNWINEAKKFVPQLKILVYSGTNRNEMIKRFHFFDIVIAGYGILRNDADALANIEFNYIILDESQTIKNSTSKTYTAIMKLRSNHRITLTGTPLENSLTDLWSQMNFINPGILGNLALFKKRFVNPIEKNANEDASERLKKLIYPFILRRTKQQVLKDLPELVEQVVFCEMSEEQQEIYEREKSKTRNNILEHVENGTFEKSAVDILQGLMKLRQIACNPQMTNEDYEFSSGKTEEIMRTLQSIVSQGHKVLIFSSFVKHLEIIAHEIQDCGLDYALLTGNTQRREEEVNKFNSNNDVPIFLISIKAGGTGLNLTQADYVFIIDPWWNPAVEDQAIARAHRMGQKNSVMVYRFISKDTVEEKILKYQEKKADLASNFVSENAVFNPTMKEQVLEILE